MYIGNQFGGYQQNLNIIQNPSHINHEEEEKEREKELEYKGGDKIVFALKRNYISKFLVNFCKKEKNEKLDELLSDLVSYKIEHKFYDPFNFKKIIFENIEKMIIEISCLSNTEKRSERIQKLFSWYKEKFKVFEDLRKIQEKSYKEKNEVDDYEIFNEKELKKKKEEKEIIINEEEKIVKENLRHRNQDFLNKDMLEDYKRKHIKSQYTLETNKELTELESLKKKNEKLMYKTLSSTSFKNYSHTGEMTTFYSTKNGKNAFTLKKNLGFEEQKYYSLFNNYNKKYFPPLDKETKFSYSYNRPKYDYDTMIIENNIINKKIKELREKRAQEEIKERIQIFGTEKAKYKESIINKYELRNVVNMYANTNEFTSNLLTKYKLKTPNIKKPLPRRFTGINEINIKENINKEENISTKKDNSKEKIDQKRINTLKRSQSLIIRQYDFLKDNSKITTEQIKNIDNNSKSILEKDKNEIKVVKIQLKQPKEKIKRKYMNLKEDYSEIPNDVVFNIFNKNPLFKQKFLYDKMCNFKFKKEDKSIKENVENDDSESEYHNFYMSAYDFGNLKKIENFKKIRNENEKSKKTRNVHIIETFDSNKDNYLNFRRTMNSWKKDNFEKLYNKIFKSKENYSQSSYMSETKYISFKRRINIKQRKHNSLLSAMINPIEESLYPKYFLPRSGSMLLKRKTLNEKKGKGKKKKK